MFFLILLWNMIFHILHTSIRIQNNTMHSVQLLHHTSKHKVAQNRKKLCNFIKSLQLEYKSLERTNSVCKKVWCNCHQKIFINTYFSPIFKQNVKLNMTWPRQYNLDAKHFGLLWNQYNLLTPIKVIAEKKDLLFSQFNIL